MRACVVDVSNITGMPAVFGNVVGFFIVAVYVFNVPVLVASFPSYCGHSYFFWQFNCLHTGACVHAVACDPAVASVTPAASMLIASLLVVVLPPDSYISAVASVSAAGGIPSVASASALV